MPGRTRRRRRRTHQRPRRASIGGCRAIEASVVHDLLGHPGEVRHSRESSQECRTQNAVAIRRQRRERSPHQEQWTERRTEPYQRANSLCSPDWAPDCAPLCSPDWAPDCAPGRVIRLRLLRVLGAQAQPTQHRAEVHLRRGRTDRISMLLGPGVPGIDTIELPSRRSQTRTRRTRQYDYRIIAIACDIFSVIARCPGRCQDRWYHP